MFSLVWAVFTAIFNMMHLAAFFSGTLFGMMLTVFLALHFLADKTPPHPEDWDPTTTRSSLDHNIVDGDPDAILTPTTATPIATAEVVGGSKDGGKRQIALSPNVPNKLGSELEKQLVIIIEYLEEVNAPLKGVSNIINQIHNKKDEESIQLESKMKTIIEFQTITKIEKEFSDNVNELKDFYKQLKLIHAFFNDFAKVFNSLSRDLLKLANTAKNNMNRNSAMEHKEDLIVNSWWQLIQSTMEYLAADQLELAGFLSDELTSHTQTVVEELMMIEKRLQNEGNKQFVSMRDNIALFETRLKEREKHREKAKTSSLSAATSSMMGYSSTSGEQQLKKLQKVKESEASLVEQTKRLYACQREFFSLMPRITSDVQLTILKSIVEVQGQFSKLIDAMERNQQSNRSVYKKMKLQLTNAAASMLQMVERDNKFVLETATSPSFALDCIRKRMDAQQAAQATAAMGTATSTTGGGGDGNGSNTSGDSNNAGSSSSASASTSSPQGNNSVPYHNHHPNVLGYEISLQKVLEGLLLQSQLKDISGENGPASPVRGRSMSSAATAGAVGVTTAEVENAGKLNMFKESSACLAASNPQLLPEIPSIFNRAIGIETCVWFNAFTGRVYRDIANSEYFYHWSRGKLQQMLNRRSAERPAYIDEFLVTDVEFGELPPLLMNVKWNPYLGTQQRRPSSKPKGAEQKKKGQSPAGGDGGADGGGETEDQQGNTTKSFKRNSFSARSTSMSGGMSEKSTSGANGAGSTKSTTSSSHHMPRNSTVFGMSAAGQDDEDEEQGNESEEEEDDEFDENGQIRESFSESPANQYDNDDPYYYAACTADMAFRSGIKFTVATKLWLNWPRDRYASVPVIFHLELAEMVGRIRFGVTRNYSFITFLRNPTVRINVRSEVGNEKYKLKDIPQVSDFIVKKMKQFIKKRFVSPHCHKFRLIWPRNWWPKGTENLFVGVPVQIPASVTANLPPEPGAPAAAGTTSAAGVSTTNVPGVPTAAVAGTPAVTATVPAPSVHANVTPAVVVAVAPPGTVVPPPAEPTVQYRFNDFSDVPIAPDSASKRKSVSGTASAAAGKSSKVVSSNEKPSPEKNPGGKTATSTSEQSSSASSNERRPSVGGATPSVTSNTVHAATIAAVSAYTATVASSAAATKEEEDEKSSIPPRYPRQEINSMWNKHLRSTAIKMDLSAFHGGSLYDLSDLERAVFVKSFFRYDPVLDHLTLREKQRERAEKKKLRMQEKEQEKQQQGQGQGNEQTQETPRESFDNDDTTAMLSMVQSPHHPVLDTSLHYEENDATNFLAHTNASGKGHKGSSNNHDNLDDVTRCRMRRSHSLSEFRGLVLEIALDRFLSSMDLSAMPTGASANATTSRATTAGEMGASSGGRESFATSGGDVDIEESEYERGAFSISVPPPPSSDLRASTGDYRDSTSSPSAADRRASMSLLGRQSSSANASAAVAAIAGVASPKASTNTVGGSRSEPRPVTRQRRLSETAAHDDDDDDDLLTVDRLKAKGKESVAMAKAKFLEFRNKHFHHNQQQQRRGTVAGSTGERVSKMGMLKEMLFADGDATASSSHHHPSTQQHQQPIQQRKSFTTGSNLSVSAPAPAAQSVEGDVIDFSAESPVATATTTAAGVANTKRRTSLEPSEQDDGNSQSLNRQSSTKATAMKYVASMFRSKDNEDGSNSNSSMSSTHGAPTSTGTSRDSSASSSATILPHRLSSSKIDTSSVTGSGSSHASNSGAGSSTSTAPTTNTGKAASMFAKAFTSVRQHMDHHNNKDRDATNS